MRTGRNITSSPTAGADYNGNIKAVRWTNKGFNEDFSGGTAKPKAYLYNYNRNNWLANATYGSADANSAVITPSGSYKEGDLTYDPNGNILSMKRTNAIGSTQDDLNYGYYSGKNQLNYVKDNITNSPTNSADLGNQNQDNYRYDEIGQLTQNISENLKYLYTAQGLVNEIQKDNHTLVKFLYNERGQLVKKENYSTANPYGLDRTTFYALDLSGKALAIYNFSNSGALLSRENNIYGLSRLGNCNSTIPNVFNYEITDHLGNIRAIVRKPSSGNITQSSIDYYPFGEQLPGRSVSITNSRYAFQGQELDQAIGMEAFQLRLWDGRIGRWLRPDPARQFASPYLGMGNNPIGMIDFDGGFARWFKWDLGWTFGVGLDKIKLTKYLQASLGVDFISAGTNSDGETTTKFFAGKGGLTLGKYSTNVSVDVFKFNFNDEETFLGLPVYYQKSNFLAIKQSHSLWKLKADDGMNVFTHTRNKGFGPSFQYVPGNLKIAGEHFSLSDSYDVGGSFKVGIVDVEVGINFKELGEDLKKGFQDLNYLLRDGWGPFFRPILPQNPSGSNTNNWYTDR
ncbi:RHS repeat domain-containing protein [Flavobacterium ustbae]|uniref:RHS repeat domain-containing protein n=1 Tax=Flavobacterium ustbae TaxID=2488790 RepID=UPI000F7814D8|nr:RHS repeat-associated core domain-containing protein [Flavobacterium ustbae]